MSISCMISGMGLLGVVSLSCTGAPILTSSVPNGPDGPVSGQIWPGPRVTGQADERPISTGFTLVETMGDWANHGS